ncbi:hypothetical protein [Ktedonobacter robiniae]|uniref:Uncharacterized protein n=1 Tax=Ktedonobacter robiniae TaxID=2778365 RepID=A0ABQ3UZS3_9CHLR|nr:hypothetical protein [Ktedonobacter robiniae]GHO58162.1 hypothetical protein KSB_66370 [Ktedonobacter robiniae]
MKSHIIPKFAAEWIKRTSATGFMRQMEQPNLRRQDFPTFRLLCASCEGIFARWEKQFAEEIFIPYQEKRPKNMPYGDWLLRFAISLAWRTTVISAEDFRQESPELAPYVDRALRSWKTFLLGEDQRWGTYAHHLFFLDDIAPSSTMPVPEKTHWYL